MTQEHWFIRTNRAQAQFIAQDSTADNALRRDMLHLICARIDGASLIIEGEPDLFIALCKLRNEIGAMRVEVL